MGQRRSRILTVASEDPQALTGSCHKELQKRLQGTADVRHEKLKMGSLAQLLLALRLAVSFQDAANKFLSRIDVWHQRGLSEYLY